MILVATWDHSELGTAAREALGAATQMAGGLGDEVVLVALGGPGPAASAGAYGAARAIVVEGDLASSGGEGSLAALAEVARQGQTRALLLPSDDRTAEIASRLAERLGGTAVTQTVGVEVTEGQLRLTRAAYGGKALAEVTARAEPVVATLRRGAFEAPAPSERTAEIATFAAPPGDGAVELLEVEAAAAGAALEDASVVVSGGAGMGAAEAFSALDELAGLLGASVGASLAAVDAGWAPTERQVGLTGKTVSPDVYFALGISGASQHLAGIGGAKAVVAVNSDPDAPIFARARLGVVMDCRTFVTAMVERLRNNR